jgi:tetratricopeptide (TPR) repeat protein
MADGTAKPVIFISYSHKDEPKNPGPKDECWLTFVQSHLQPAVKHGIYDLWDDQDIPGGSTWRADITKKLDECDICVLLVSRHSLASDFIIDVEIETLRRRRAKGEAEIFPIVLSHCAVKTAPWINEINLRPANGQPLSDFDENSRHKEMAKIAEEIAEIAARIAERKKVATATAILGRPIARALEPHIPPDAALAAASASAHFHSLGESPDLFRSIRVDIAHLPETAYERLVGRDDELKRLDDAWTDSKINIISLIAEGGAGKSALVNEWLKRLQADNYRSAEAVLGWSFYSQGSKERATSAEEFLNWALDRLGITVATTSASAKGEAIAEALAKRRVLLVLDGVEPLQHGLDKQQGELKDAGLRALLRRLASTPPGQAHNLIVLTSRLAVKDIARWQNDAAPVIDVEKLSDEAGAALLRDNGVWGTDKELKAAAHDFGGHPLALGLLASFLKETQTGDVRQRDHIRAFFADPENPRHDHAKRVMESYEKEWLAGQPALLAIMHMVGLFDRPASGDCLNALRAKPVLEGLTGEVVSLDDSEWQRAVTRLREVRLLLPRDPTAPDALDAHPLVREWFGDRLKATNEKAWRAAHGRLYEHLRDTTKEGNTPTLEDLAPLYQAIAHGCRAGRHEDALSEVYAMRIIRRTAGGELMFYSKAELGAFGSDLAAISNFFERPYDCVAREIKDLSQTFFLLGEAAASLRAQARFEEALAAFTAALTLAEVNEEWLGAANVASNISQMTLSMGELGRSIAAAESCARFAGRKQFSIWSAEAELDLARCRMAAGRVHEATGLISNAVKETSEHSLTTYPMQIYSYCDALLASGAFKAAMEYVQKTANEPIQQHGPFDLGIYNLASARALFRLICEPVRRRTIEASSKGIVHVRDCLNQSVDQLHRAGHNEHIPYGLIARAAFRRSTGDWNGAARDLDEVEEIAEPGPMRLYLCDMAIERARLAFAKIEAFAPLNGILEKDNPSKPVVPSAEESAELKSEAERQLKIAADYIETCGYHRRDEELAELKAVLHGEKKFADLPPRV